MDTAESYRAFFATWPKDLPVDGNVVTIFGETIPFKSYAVSAGLLLLERDIPDSYGSRRVVLGYNQIAALKLCAPTDLAIFQSIGFKQVKH
jgi:hypothetical protein